MVMIIEKLIREMNLDIYRVIEFIFFHINMSFVKAGIRWNFGVFLLRFFELIPK